MGLSATKLMPPTYNKVMGRLQNSISIFKQSLAILRSNPSLAIFPVISSIAVVIASIPFALPLILTTVNSGSHPVLGTMHYILGAVSYFVTYAVIIFFNTGLVACADKTMRGEPASVSDGIQVALARLPKILGWALIAATVGQILKAIQERAGLIGTIVAGIIGMAWNLVVFMVIPFIALENLGPIDALKASASKLKATWGEQLIGGVGLGLASLVFVVLPLFIGIFAGVACLIAGLSPVVGIAFFVLGGLWMLIGMAVVSCLTTIYQTAVFHYAQNGSICHGFSAEVITTAFMPKPQSTFFKGRNR